MGLLLATNVAGGMAMDNLTRRSAVGLVTFGMVGLAVPAIGRSRRLSLEEVIDRHVRAQGGRAALDAVRAKAVDLTIAEGGSTIRGRYRCNAAPAFRIDVYASDKHVFCEGLDARGPWLWPSGSAAPRDGN